MTPILDCRALSVAYGGMPTVSDVTFSIAPGECFALVGASGSGKSTIAQAVLGLHRPTTRVTGELLIDGEKLSAASEREWAALRGFKVGYIAQDPYAACDPLKSVGHHVREAWRAKGDASAEPQVAKRLSALGIAEAAHMATRAPHCWSGGMLQRACITAASAHTPPLLVADEPTSALDADRADGVLATLRANGSGILLISHDLDLVRRHADRIGIVDRGRLVDVFAAGDLGEGHQHPVTRALSNAVEIASSPPNRESGRLLATATRIGRRYRNNGPAIGNLSCRVRAGSSLGIRGSSGSGKSTVLRMLAGLEAPDEGRVDFDPSLRRRGAIMPIFQNPASSLNAFWPIWRVVSEPAAARHRLSRPERRRLAQDLLAKVGLEGADLDARPNEFSLGQCQRISITRAIAADPILLVADEPTSALDTVARAQVIGLLGDLVQGGMALVIASHDPWVHGRLGTEGVEVSSRHH